MKSVHEDSTKRATMTVRLTPQVSDKLDALARDTKRSKAYLASEAIASFVDVNAWQVARIKQALDDTRSGAPGVSHQRVVEWMDSWDSAHPLPRPEPHHSR